MIEKVYVVAESLNEFAKRGRPRKKSIDSTDSWGGDDSEFDVELEGPDEIEDVDIDIDDEEMDHELKKRIIKILKNELSSPEFNRRYLMFRIKGNKEVLNGIPMAELKDAFLFKINGKFKKVKIDDIVLSEYEDY